MGKTLRHCISILLLAVICSHSTAGQSVESGTLVVNADTPIVEIGARPPGRNFMRLPSLSYKFELMSNCAAGLTPQAISLSIADTRKSLAPDSITHDSSTLISLRIPASQIGPIAVEGFCVTANEQESLRIQAVLSVQAALLCGNDADSRMVYASKSLDVTLSCKDSQ